MVFNFLVCVCDSSVIRIMSAEKSIMQTVVPSGGINKYNIPFLGLCVFHSTYLRCDKPFGEFGRNLLMCFVNVLKHISQFFLGLLQSSFCIDATRYVFPSIALFTLLIDDQTSMVFNQ